jgi:hypothetical protein
VVLVVLVQVPEFDELAFLPRPDCNSASAQFVVQAQCLNQRNCTLDVKSNVTYEWTVSDTAPCAEGLQQWDPKLKTHSCFTSLQSPASNFSNCPAQLADRRLMVRGLCSETVFDSATIDAGAQALHDLFGYKKPSPEHSRAYWSKVRWREAIQTTYRFLQRPLCEQVHEGCVSLLRYNLALC